MRSRALPDSKDSSKIIRYLSLICLNCQSLIYRVSRPSVLNGEERPGPVIPTEEWVEKDVLKTSTGKVEVHKECLVRFNPDTKVVTFTSPFADGSHRRGKPFSRKRRIRPILAFSVSSYHLIAPLRSPCHQPHNLPPKTLLLNQRRIYPPCRRYSCLHPLRPRTQHFPISPQSRIPSPRLPGTLPRSTWPA